MAIIQDRYPVWPDIEGTGVSAVEPGVGQSRQPLRASWKGEGNLVETSLAAEQLGIHRVLSFVIHQRPGQREIPSLGTDVAAADTDGPGVCLHSLTFVDHGPIVGEPCGNGACPRKFHRPDSRDVALRSGRAAGSPPSLGPGLMWHSAIGPVLSGIIRFPLPQVSTTTRAFRMVILRPPSIMFP
jgi:hypothetical protein